MSDDEYYYDDPDYEDFQDMLYDADPAPGLADDLAERAAYSPVWQDNPTEELRDYFSDWEYYSDDYFDDDPNLLNGAKPGDGGSGSASRGRRGRKRKLSEAREGCKPNRRETAALAACLQGTVWKSATPEPMIPYKHGVEGPVSLKLSDEIMRAAYSKTHGFGKGRIKRDESWANDLSLADMGLKAERSMSTHEQSAVEDAGQEDDDEYSISGNGDDAVITDERAMLSGTIVDEPYHLDIQAEPSPMTIREIQVEVDEGTGPRKKRRKETADAACAANGFETLSPAQTDTPVNEDLISTAEASQQPGKRKRRGGRPSKPSKLDMAQEANDDEMEITKKPSVTGRKRKLSVSENSVASSTASSPVKRVDSKSTSKEPDSNVRVVTAAATRPSRTRRN